MFHCHTNAHADMGMMAFATLADKDKKADKQREDDNDIEDAQNGVKKATSKGVCD